MSGADHDRLQRWVSLEHPADVVWREIGDFGRIADWHPWIDRSELLEIEGRKHRQLTMVNGDLHLEELLKEERRFYTYSTVQGPLSLEDHRATLSCVPEEGGCHIFWSAYFTATDPAVDELVLAFLEAGLNALREMFVAQST